MTAAVFAVLLAFAAPAPTVDDEQIDIAYQHLLDRPAEPAARAWWRTQPADTYWDRMAATPEAAGADPTPPTAYIRARIADVFPDQMARALAVFRCESSYRLDAVGGAGEYGLAQIHPVHGTRWGPRVGLFDLEVNLRAARDLYAESGWRPWTCAR